MDWKNGYNVISRINYVLFKSQNKGCSSVQMSGEFPGTSGRIKNNVCGETVLDENCRSIPESLEGNNIFYAKNA